MIVHFFSSFFRDFISESDMFVLVRFNNFSDFSVERDLIFDILWLPDKSSVERFWHKERLDMSCTSL